MSDSLPVLEYDGIIIGGGGAGLRAGLQLAQSGMCTAVVSKVFPTRSHTVSAQGGITCAIGSDDPDDRWQWHMYDTIKGSDYIGDQDAIEYMCHEGPTAVYELEHMGLPFSRNPDGRIYQRPFGGQSREYGKGGQAARTCAAADRTGHALLHTLYQANIKAGTRFLNEWFAVDLIVSAQGEVCGVIAIDIATGETCILKSRVTVLATGGAGRIYQSTTNAHINTGDGVGMALRAGFVAQDMEMWQFHPTGIYGAGVLVTEGCRGEGGYLVNKDGERFMERYAPNALDLASRDVVARSMVLEILAGRGLGENSDHVLLKLDHLGEDVLNTRLPGICELAKTFAHVDPARVPIPVVPTCHYMMGGIPTNIHGQAITVDETGNQSTIPGLYAAGEVACVSVHGANRLGGNSLLDLVVFGRAAGQHIESSYRGNGGLPQCEFSDSDIEHSLQRMHGLERESGESVAQVREELQRIMQNHFGVFREGDFMLEGITKLNELRATLANLKIADTSSVFNTARIEALELGNLFEVAYATAIAAEQRRESRGAHARNDFTERDDENWLAHSVFHPSSSKITQRAVNFDINIVDESERDLFKPQKRTY